MTLYLIPAPKTPIDNTTIKPANQRWFFKNPNAFRDCVVSASGSGSLAELADASVNPNSINADAVLLRSLFRLDIAIMP